MDERSRPDHDGDLVATLTELTALLLSTPDVEDALQEIADIASRMLPGQPMTGITLARGGQVMTVAGSEAHALLIDEVQYSDGQGPCLESMRANAPVLVPDVLEESRWGSYPERMLAHGVRSIYSHPLRADGTVLGALNLYSARVRGFDDEAQRAVRLTAEHTGVLLAAALRAARQDELTVQMRAALASRSVIDQAMGIIMAQQRCDAPAAFAILRTASHHRNRKLRDLAADIVQQVTGKPPQPGGFTLPDTPTSPDT